MKTAQFLALTSVLMFSLVSFAQEAPSVQKWNLKSMQGFNEATTQSMAKAIKAKIEERCEALSESDSVKLISESAVKAFEYGGREIQTSSANPNCDSDLPCSTVPTVRVDSYILRESEMLLSRRGGDESYSIKITTRWDLDLPAPMPSVEIQSERCH